MTQSRSGGEKSPANGGFAGLSYYVVCNDEALGWLSGVWILRAESRHQPLDGGFTVAKKKVAKKKVAKKVAKKKKK